MRYLDFLGLGFCALLSVVACGGGDESGGGSGGKKDAGAEGASGTGGAAGIGGASGVGGAAGASGSAGSDGGGTGGAGSGGAAGSDGGGATGGSGTGGAAGSGATGGAGAGGTGAGGTGTGGTGTGGAGSGGTGTGGTGTGGTGSGGSGVGGAAGAGGTTDGGPGDAGSECATDADCANTSYCDGVEQCVNGKCAAGTPVVCPDDGKSCTSAVCDEASQSCKTFKNDAACNDGLYCNGVEVCDPAGAPAGSPTGCKPGTPVDCNDNVSCTVDSCDEASDSCTHSNNDNVCSDGQYCNGVETCAPGTTGANATTGCVPGTAPNCEDGLGCTTDGCDESKDQCVHVPDSSKCQDGLYCNGAEVCDPTQGCKAGTPVSCPNTDGLTCTVESCNEATDSCDSVIDPTKCPVGQICSPGNGSPPSGCLVQTCTNHAQCSDGNACNGVETCDLSVPGGQCKPGTPVSCNDGVDCTFDECNPGTGACTHTPIHAFCNDGDVCDGIESCNPTLGCVEGTPLTCNDQKSCTADSCIPSLGCFYTPVDSACADSTVCDGGEVCDPCAIYTSQASCAAATGCVWNASTSTCGATAAAAGTGCIDLPGSIQCPNSDGIACTVESCQEAKCKPKPCNSFTTQAACAVAPGCTWASNACVGAPTTSCSAFTTQQQCSSSALCVWFPGGCFSKADDSLCNNPSGNPPTCGYKCDTTLGCVGPGTWCKPGTCQGKVYACGDCLDNDGDCKVDSQDPHCIGTCSDNEAGFKGEIPGQNNAACKMDCYFDADSGSGNDDCHWDHRCDGAPPIPPGYPNPQYGDGCAYDPSFKFPGNKTCADYAASQSAQCAGNMSQPTPATGYCGPLVPNGCDCFGCCVFPQLNYGTVTLHGVTMNVGVYLGSAPNKQSPGTCDINDILSGNPNADTNCHKCAQVPSCLNTCAPCEICVGKPDPGCEEQVCPAGVQKCGLPGQPPCPDGQYCVTGCCAQNPI